MKVSDIDKDLIEIIDYMNNKGLKPWASCDGVIAHHDNNQYLADAQVAVLESEYTIDLLSNAYDIGFGIGINSYKEPYEVYGNVISDLTFEINYPNKNGENSKKFENLVKTTVEKKMIPNEKTQKFVTNIISMFPRKKTDLAVSLLLRDANSKFVKDTRESTITIHFTNKLENEIIYSLDVCNYIKEKYEVEMYEASSFSHSMPGKNYSVHRNTARVGYIVLDNSEFDLAIKIVKDLFEHKFEKHEKSL